MTTKEEQIIEKSVQLLKDRYSGDTSGHDWAHLERVWFMAKRLAKHYHLNQFVLEMAALTHDVDDFKFKTEQEEELSGTKSLLDQYSIDKKEYDHILEIVKNVSYKGSGVATPQQTIEGQIVQDADRLDALGAIGIARTFTYGGHKGRLMYDPLVKPRKGDTFEVYKTAQSTTINHFYEKLLLVKDRLNTPEAKKIGIRRHKYVENFLKEFLSEVRQDI